jgi:hypothetical protein
MDNPADRFAEMMRSLRRVSEDTHAVGRAMDAVKRGEDGGGAEGGVPRGTRVPIECSDGSLEAGIVASGVVFGRQIVRPEVPGGRAEVVAIRTDALARNAGLPGPTGHELRDTYAAVDKQIETFVDLAGSVLARPLPIGVRVVLCGLQSKPRLNGQEGVVVASPDGAATCGTGPLDVRQAVRLAGSGETVSVKPKNMRQLPASPSP